MLSPTIYDRYMSPAQAGLLLERMRADQDWSPPGGTSNNTYRRMGGELDTAFVAEFTARIGERHETMWFKDHGAKSLYVGWRDDPRGGYYVAHGLEHQARLAPELLRSFAYLVYSRERAEGDTEDHGEVPAGYERYDSRVGHHWFTPPHAHDVALHVQHLLMWLDAHRRTLTGLTDTPVITTG